MRAASSGSASKSGISANGEYVAGDGGTSGAAADGAVASGSTSGGSAVGGSATGAVGGSATGVVDGSTTGAVDGSTTGSGGGVAGRELGGDAGKDGAASPSGMILACSTTSSFGWHPGHGQLQPHCDVSLHTWLRPSGPRTSQMHRRPAALACVHPQVESVSGGDGGGEGTTHSQLSAKELVKAILVTTMATAITAALGVRENPTNGATPTSWLETGPSPPCSEAFSGAWIYWSSPGWPTMQ